MRWILTFMMVAIVGLTTYMAGCSVTGDNDASATKGCEYTALGLNAVNPTCYDEGIVYFNVDNTGSVAMSGLKVYLEASYNMSISIKDQINPGAPIKKRLAFGNQGITNFKSITINKNF